MTTVGFVGSGMIGGTVARLSLAAGHDAVLSNSRGPDTLKDLVSGLGPMARAATAEDAADAGDIVVVAIPLRAYRSVPVRPLVGKAVIDANNYYPERDGQLADLDAGRLTSSELLQHHLRTSSVVKAFNNILARSKTNAAARQPRRPRPGCTRPRMGMGRPWPNPSGRAAHDGARCRPGPDIRR